MSLSPKHEAIVELLRENPELVVTLFRNLVGDACPEGLTARVSSESFSEVKTAPHAADLVLQLSEGKTHRFGIVTEVQLDLDPDKLFAWPVYAAGLRAKLRCPVAVMVVAPSERVAQWARKPIVLGPGGIFQPVVLGRKDIPAILDLEQALQSPALAVVSALAHAQDAPETAARVAFNALRAAMKLNHRLFVTCQDIIQAALSSAALAQLEKLMQLNLDNLQTEAIRRNVVAGEIKAKAADILIFLDARQIALTQKQRDRIANCEDLDQLNRWIREAVTVASADELFVD